MHFSKVNNYKFIINTFFIYGIKYYKFYLGNINNNFLNISRYSNLLNTIKLF